MPRAIRSLLMLAAAALIASCSKGTVTSTTSTPSATLMNGAVQLEWNPVPDTNVTGYRVYYGPVSRPYAQPFGQGLGSTAPAYMVAGLAGPRRYFFAVTATN